MFKKLRSMVEEKLDRWEAAQGVRDEDVDDVIDAMRKELVRARARVAELETELPKVLREANGERERARTAERRVAQAEEIGDAETAEVGQRFAAKHRRRLEVLVLRAEALKAELDQLRDDVAQGTEQMKQALARRGELAARGRRAQAIGNAAGRSDAASDFDRVVERMEGRSSFDDALRELDEELDSASAPPRPDPALERDLREERADAMLEELKRRMARGE